MCGSVHSRSHGIFSIQIIYLNLWGRWVLSVTPAPWLQCNHFSFLWSKVCFFLPISSAIAVKSDCLWEQLQLVSAQAVNYPRAGQVGWAFGIAKVFVCWKFLIMNDYISYNGSYFLIVFWLVNARNRPSLHWNKEWIQLVCAIREWTKLISTRLLARSDTNTITGFWSSLSWLKSRKKRKKKT